SCYSLCGLAPARELPRSALFPYTTLFRSHLGVGDASGEDSRARPRSEPVLDRGPGRQPARDLSIAGQVEGERRANGGLPRPRLAPAVAVWTIPADSSPPREERGSVGALIAGTNGGEESCGRLPWTGGERSSTKPIRAGMRSTKVQPPPRSRCCASCCRRRRQGY